jgi:hypothetical protein
MLGETSFEICEAEAALVITIHNQTVALELWNDANAAGFNPIREGRFADPEFALVGVAMTDKLRDTCFKAWGTVLHSISDELVAFVPPQPILDDPTLLTDKDKRTTLSKMIDDMMACKAYKGTRVIVQVLTKFEA